MIDWLYCPCCGKDAAESDTSGCFYDGQPITCGCVGHVSVSAEPTEEPYVWVDDDCPCIGDE